MRELGILATAPVIKAEEREVSFAVATITLFGTRAVFVFPAVGLWLDLPDAVYGVWAGIAVSGATVRRGVAGAVPMFVLGFLAFAALRTFGAIDDAQAARLDDAAKALILVALAGVGLNTRVAQMRAAGLTPVL